MPVVGIPVNLLQAVVGRRIDGVDLQEKLSLMGCDVEDLESVRRTRCNRCGFITEMAAKEDLPAACGECGAPLREEGASAALPDLEVVRMDLLAVRPDLFDPGGLGRALRGYLGIETGPSHVAVEAARRTLSVDAAVTRATSFRPKIVAAVLEDVDLDDETLKVLMKLQENLHWALGRNRKHASIGVYDLDTIEPPFVYTAKDPDRFAFRALGTEAGETWPLRRILDEHPKGRAYRHLLEGFTAYPILMDSKGRVLSMPPIINSEETRVTSSTRRLFIDVTGLGQGAVTGALNILVTSLKELMPAARIGAVSITEPDGTVRETPDLRPQRRSVRVSEASRMLGIPLDRPRAVELLGRMRHGIEDGAGDEIGVLVPAYRTDILHEMDLVEDVAIAYGYDKIPQLLLPATTTARESRVEILSQRAREILTGLGLVEVLTLVLTGPEVNDTLLGRPPSTRAVRIANPISREQSQLRTDLAPGLLQVLQQNRHRPLPQHIFEIGDVTLLDQGSETGAREERRLACAVVHPRVGFAEIKGMAEAILREFGAAASLEQEGDLPYLSGRAARATVSSGQGGARWAMTFGEIHPEVLERLGLANPVVALEGSLLALAGIDPLRQDVFRKA